MNQAHKKIKLVQSKPSKKDSRSLAPSESVSSTQAVTAEAQQRDREAVEITAFWRSEIDALQGKKFNSVADAIDALVDMVLDRLGVNGPERAETRDYMVVLFDTDPELQEELSQVLAVKGSDGDS